MTPQVSTTESSFEFKSADALASASMVIESLGVSAARAREFGMSASAGGGAFGFSFNIAAGLSHHGSSAEASNHNAETSQQKSHSGSEFHKLRVIQEPRALIVVNSNMIQPTAALKKAIVKYHLDVEEGKDPLEAAQVLFNQFGTHVCPSVTLGGMWELRARFYSETEKTNVEMNAVVTRAIEQAQSTAAFSQASGSGWGFHGSAGIKGGGAGQTAENRGSAEKAVSEIQSKKEQADVEQEWKGGVSGGSASQWRASLSKSKNSNWKVVDTDMNQCIEHWKWITPDNMPDVFGQTHKQVRQSLFNAYRNLYFGTQEELNLDADLANSWIVLRSDGFEQDSPNCANTASFDTQEKRDNACKGAMRCWQRGKTYSYSQHGWHGELQAPVGCHNNECCTHMKDFPEGSSCCGFTPGQNVCAAGLECRRCTCTDANRLGVALRDRMSHKCLDSGVPGKLEMHWCSGALQQQWYWEGEQLKTTYDLKKCLDVHAEGVVMWDCHGGENQKWYFNGEQLKSKSSDSCLHVDNNVGVTMHPWYGGTNQKWFFSTIATKTADWSTSFDHEGWGRSGSGGIIGFLKHGEKNAGLWALDEVEYADFTATDCVETDWRWSFDVEGWSWCGRNQFITGIYRSSGSYINAIETVSCCRNNHQSYKGECQNVDWRHSMEQNGWWSKCPAGMAIVGLKRDRMMPRMIKTNTNWDPWCLDYDVHTGNVNVHPCHGRGNQKWYFDTGGERIKSEHDGKCLARSPHHWNEWKTYMWDCNDNDDQKWYWDGQQLRGKHDHKCLDDHSRSEMAHMYWCNGQDNQKFRWEGHDTSGLNSIVEASCCPYE